MSVNNKFTTLSFFYLKLLKGYSIYIVIDMVKVLFFVLTLSIPMLKVGQDD